MKREKTDTTSPVSEAKVTCVIELPSNTYQKLLRLSVYTGKSINKTVRFLVEESCKCNAIDAAIERLQELELTVARYERIYDSEANAEVEQEYRKEIRQLARERDEARKEAEILRGLYKDATGVTGTFPWEVGSK